MAAVKLFRAGRPRTRSAPGSPPGNTPVSIRTRTPEKTGPMLLRWISKAVTPRDEGGSTEPRGW